MKQIKEQLKEVGVNAHTACAEKVNGEWILPTSLQKFKDVESLCKAYNSLESEFTKRCQRIKELEGKLEKLCGPSFSDTNDSVKAETEARKANEIAANSSDKIAVEKAETNQMTKAFDETEKPKENVDNGTIGRLIASDKGNFEGTINNSVAESAEEPFSKEQDFCKKESETASDKVYDKTLKCEAITKPTEVEVQKTIENLSTDGLKETVSEGNKVVDVLEFFKNYPESTAHIGELEALCGGDFSLSSLQRAYIEILKKKEAAAPAVHETEVLPEAVKLMVIKDYLNSLRKKEGPTLMGGSGVIPMTPPVRPKNIAEAGALAQNIIKLK